MAAPLKPIGGFFGLEPPAGPPGPAANFGGPHQLHFWNARSALAHLLSTVGARRVWMPAYICVETASAAAEDGRDVLFYSVGRDLTPNGTALAAGLLAGDAVVGVDYFGTRAETLPELAPRFPDVTWVQDRAQALWPDHAPWGDYLLYSPRKLVGVPDGGVLVSHSGPVSPPHWAPDLDQSRLQPARLRAEDPQGLRSATWFPAYRAAEAAMTSAPRPISEVSRLAVEAVDPAALLQRRRRNAKVLLDRVGEAALLPEARLLGGAPFGVPVLTQDAGEAVARMAEARIFCARHWAELPSRATDFPVEHALARQLLTLPCDHRYDDDDMARVAEAFMAAR